MVTEEIIYLMGLIGYKFNDGHRTGWYEAGNLVGFSHKTILGGFRGNWSRYFINLAKSFDFEDWSEDDLRMWDILRAVEEYLFGDDEEKLTQPWG